MSREKKWAALMTRPLQKSSENPAHTIAPEGRIVKLSDARRRRAEALLRDEEIPDQEAEARAWNDRPGAA